MKKLLVLLFCLAAPLAWGQTSLWQVSKEHHQLLIAGSVPLLGRDDYPLPEAFEQAYQISDKIYFQTDIGALNQPQFAARAMQTMMYRDGRTLRSVLSTPVWEQLQTFSARRKVPALSFLMFKPAFAVMTLTVLETKRLDLGRGVDGHFYGRATKADKPRGFLESVDQQLQLLDQLNDLDADRLVSTTLVELDAMADNAEPLVNAWRQGDTDALYQLTGKKLREQAPDLYTSLVTNRNRAWLPQLDAMLNTPELELVVIDGLNLAGEKGLLQLLRDEGYTVTAFQL